MYSSGKYNSRTVANSFLTLASQEEKVLTHMQVQKLSFLAHGWGLAFDNHLINDEVQAWRYGPVFPQMYSAFQRFGHRPIPSLFFLPDGTAPLIQDDDDLELLEAVLNGYGHFSGPELSTLTHRPNSPWDQTYEDGKNVVIPDRIIKRYFSELKKAQDRQV